jgi:asparagine synthase (glutamine-hydrolysing)
MCGIAGVIATSSEDTGQVVARMTEALVHRGPDDGGQIILPIGGERQLGLGHRRLSILDLSPRGHQPMTFGDSGSWISYNGEIYNFRELREELEAAGTRFQSESDTEVLLAAYDAYGIACLDKLRGMFAFAIWDARKRTLLLARDRLGIKPLYYFCENGRLLFASELRSLLASGLVPRKLSTDGLLSYLAYGAVQQPLSLVEQVACLLPGHLLRWRDGEVRIERYWNPLESTHSDVDFEQLRSCLDEAARLRLISDVPLGVFLSGGIDSSALVALMSQASSETLKTFTIGFAEADFDERAHARTVAKRFGTDHTEFELSSGEVLGYVDAAITAMDQPSIDCVNTYLISKIIKQAGITVAISGLGGDELFAGYSSFKNVPRADRFLALWCILPASLRRLAATAWERVTPRSYRSDQIRGILAGEIEGGHSYFLSRALFTCAQRDRLLGDGIPREIGESAYLAHHERLLSEVARLDPINAVSVLELNCYMGNMLLRDSDQMSMAHSLELRVPLVDHQLVELALSIPGSRKLGRRTPKQVLVRAMDPLLPDSVVYRRKQGFTFPFAQWLREDLRSDVESVLGDESFGVSRIVHRRGIEQAWQSFLAGRTPWACTWALYVLKRWTHQLELTA